MIDPLKQIVFVLICFLYWLGIKVKNKEIGDILKYIAIVGCASWILIAT